MLDYIMCVSVKMTLLAKLKTNQVNVLTTITYEKKRFGDGELIGEMALIGIASLVVGLGHQLTIC